MDGEENAKVIHNAYKSLVAQTLNSPTVPQLGVSMNTQAMRALRGLQHGRNSAGDKRSSAPIHTTKQIKEEDLENSDSDVGT